MKMLADLLDRSGSSQSPTTEGWEPDILSTARWREGVERVLLLPPPPLGDRGSVVDWLYNMTRCFGGENVRRFFQSLAGRRETFDDDELPWYLREHTSNVLFPGKAMETWGQLFDAMEERFSEEQLAETKRKIADQVESGLERIYSELEDFVRVVPALQNEKASLREVLAEMATKIIEPSPKSD